VQKIGLCRCNPEHEFHIKAMHRHIWCGVHARNSDSQL
jgi:hypothetical protein